ARGVAVGGRGGRGARRRTVDDGAGVLKGRRVLVVARVVTRAGVEVVAAVAGRSAVGEARRGGRCVGGREAVARVSRTLDPELDLLHAVQSLALRGALPI